jgi:hypothetical protein
MLIIKGFAKMKNILVLILVLFSIQTVAKAADVDFDNYTNTSSLQSTDEFLLYRSGVGMMNWTPDYFAIDASGNITGPASLLLPNSGLYLMDTDGLQELLIKPASNLSADRTLNIATGDANRTLTIGADSSISGTAYVASGTDVALADGGTGASLTDPNADRILFWDDSAGAATWLTAGTGLSITGTTLAATAAAPMLDITLHGAGGTQITNSSSSNTFLGNSTRHVAKVDLTNYTQARLLVNIQGTADTTADLVLRYSTTYQTVAGSYSTAGSTEITVPLATINSMQDSGWIDLVAGAKADVFLAAIVLDVTSAATVLGNVHVQFR